MKARKIICRKCRYSFWFLPYLPKPTSCPCCDTVNALTKPKRRAAAELRGRVLEDWKLSL